jgi:hypothetical protein
MKRFRPLILALALIALWPISGAVIAQTANPVLDFGTFEIEIQPEKGPVQGAVSRIATIEDVNGTTVDLELATGFLTEDGWQQATVVWDDVPGKWAEVELGDGFTLRLERETGDG